MMHRTIKVAFSLMVVIAAAVLAVSPAGAEQVLNVAIGMDDAGQLDPHISSKTFACAECDD